MSIELIDVRLLDSVGHSGYIDDIPSPGWSTYFHPMRKEYLLKVLEEEAKKSVERGFGPLVYIRIGKEDFLEIGLWAELDRWEVLQCGGIFAGMMPHTSLEEISSRLNEKGVK